MAQNEVKLVKLTIDGVDYEVPENMNLVDAAKLCGVDIPVFCYHPKLGHDANCRMCLVEMATMRPNRESGDMELAWWPGLQTACNQTVSAGMAIKTTSETVQTGQKEILELLLSSHPLDCPVCDKGGECPLQNLTMEHGPGTSRMYWDDKMRLGKSIPLGEIIYLDQERCIHCARCIRFQEIVADDPVLAFDYRGRKQQIITYSEPGFDSIFSGNTTDICPVGALTTADFRFNARPWEMQQVATICSHTPEGSNMYFDTRTDRLAGGRTVIKRVMPRQNEAVNEIWISDKSRFGHHYMDHPDRLTQPLLRKGGKLVEATWDEALDEITAQLNSAGADIAAIGGGRLSNEDLFVLQQLVRGQGSNNLSPYPAHSVGAEFVAQAGVGTGTDLQQLGAGDAILVVASDLHQEAPVWWLRVKAAAERGATVIVVNGRETRLEKYATHIIRYAYGEEVATLNKLSGKQGTKAIKAAAAAFTQAENAVVFVGGEGLDAETSRNLAQSAANLLNGSGHVGRANNGLIVVWGAANTQGAFDMGFTHAWGPGYSTLENSGLDYEGIKAGLQDNELKALFIAQADPAYDDAAMAEALTSSHTFIIVQELFLTETAALADVVLPAQSIAEREGTYTSGERRVQRFFPAIEPLGESAAGWEIAQIIGKRLGGEQSYTLAVQVFNAIVENVPQYGDMTWAGLAQVEPQFPDVGGDDLYFGGTAFQNRHGLGMQWASAAESGEIDTGGKAPVGDKLVAEDGDLVIVPVAVLYDREAMFEKTELLHERVPQPYAVINPANAESLGVVSGDSLSIAINGKSAMVEAWVDAHTPEGVVLVPRRLRANGAPLVARAARVTRVETVEA